MQEPLGDRQQELVRLLLKHKDGLAIEDLREALGITNTAVRQHLAALESAGYVVKGEWRKTKGRPSRLYHLADPGRELLPGQYPWLLDLLLDDTRHNLGSEGLARYMQELGKAAARRLQPHAGSADYAGRVADTVRLLNRHGYAAEVLPDAAGGDPAGIGVNNCVYYRLGRRFIECCQFDRELIADLVGSPVTHQECIVNCGYTCRFLLRAAPPAEQAG